MNVNKVIIGGNITKPIELKSMPNGNSVAQITLATNRTWKDKDGNEQKETQYTDFVSFGKQAQTLEKYCVKGQSMLFFGRLITRSWDDKDTGQKRYKTEVILEEFQFGQKPKGGDNRSDEGRDDSGFGNYDDWGRDTDDANNKDVEDVVGKGVDLEDMLN